jgi:uncharacterized protein YigA (DUF484 family)
MLNKLVCNEATYEVRNVAGNFSDLKETKRTKIETSRAKYAALQARMKAEMEASAPNSKQQMKIHCLVKKLVTI